MENHNLIHYGLGIKEDFRIGVLVDLKLYPCTKKADIIIL